VFLDEPTSGLDPIGAADFDDLIRTLQQTLGLTVFMVTHDLDSLASSCDRIAALADKKVVAVGELKDMLSSTHPWVKSYFRGKRALARMKG
jgi:phospholipid/cholesterol/gamma-HCH transport system ATP-binding protein